LGITLGSGKSQPLCALCFLLSRYRLNRLFLLCGRGRSSRSAQVPPKPGLWRGLPPCHFQYFLCLVLVAALVCRMAVQGGSEFSAVSGTTVHSHQQVIQAGPGDTALFSGASRCLNCQLDTQRPMGLREKAVSRQAHPARVYVPLPKGKRKKLSCFSASRGACTCAA